MKWQTFCKQHFWMHFLIIWYSFIGTSFYGSNWQYVYNGSGDGFMMSGNKPEPKTTNQDPWCHMISQSHDELNSQSSTANKQLCYNLHVIIHCLEALLQINTPMLQLIIRSYIVNVQSNNYGTYGSKGPLSAWLLCSSYVYLVLPILT